MSASAPSFSIGLVPVYVDQPNGIISWTSGATIDADGGLHTYHPDDTGLDWLKDAKDTAGHWVGIVTVNGKPYVNPKTGYYVSTTSYQRKDKTVCDPARYLDAETVPYIAVPPQIIECVPQIVIGSRVICRYKDRRNQWHQAMGIVGDEGGRKRIGEISVAMAVALGIPSDPKTGGVNNGVYFEIHAGVQTTLNGELFELQPMG